MPDMILTPYDAMWREIGCWYRAMENVRASLKASVDGLDQADLDRDFGSGTPSIARLLCHAGLAEVVWITKVWRAEQIPDGWKPWFDRGRLDAGAAPLESVSADEIFTWLDEVREKTRLTLIRVTDRDIDRKIAKTSKGHASLRWILYHLVEHEAHHRGQIHLLRRLAGKPLPTVK
jgi:uncharacterized damage-inducible protein DinB